MIPVFDKTSNSCDRNFAMKLLIGRNPTIKFSPIMGRSRKKFILKKCSYKEPLANTNFVQSGTPLPLYVCANFSTSTYAACLYQKENEEIQILGYASCI